MSDETREKVKKIFLEIFPEVDDASFDFGKDRADFENWDSLSHMQLVSELESSLGLSFEMDEVVDINSVQDLVDLITNKQS